MAGATGTSRWPDVVWLAVVGILTSIWCLTASAQIGATFDEPFYIANGLKSYRTGSNKPFMSSGTMTLPVDIQTRAIVLYGYLFGEPINEAADFHHLLSAARAATLLFWWLLLFYAMRLGRTFGGSWGGRLAVAFVAFDPNLLGHASLATTDIAAVACFLGLVYHLYHGQELGWGRRVLVPGIWFGVATLAKASGMVFGIQALLVIGLCRLAYNGALSPPAGTGIRGSIGYVWHAGYSLRKDLFAIAFIGFTIVFAYTGSDWGTEWTFIEWAEHLPPGPARTVMLPLSQNLRVFPNAGEALLQQIKHNLKGHGTYLMGENYPRAVLSYFPIALTMKTPLPMLILLAAVLLLRPRSLLVPIGWVALALLVFSLNCRVQIGIRFMFPLMTITSITLAASVARGWSHPAEGGWAVPRWVVAGVVAAMAGTSIWVWPNGLSYFNQLWGGPSRGYELLHDSNYDWGQGLPELGRWHSAHGEPPLAVWYFGTDRAIADPPFRHTPLHAPPPVFGDDFRRFAGGGYLAVSVNFLHGAEGLTPSSKKAVAWLRGMQPVARTTHFLIYDLR